MSRVSLLFTFMWYCVGLHGQNTAPPEVGKVLPDYVLTRVTHHEKSSVSLRDFKGKWLLINHWYAGCRNCINDLPRLNEIQKELADQLRVVLVGCAHPGICFGDGIEETYEGLRKRLNLNMVSAYDTVIVKAWRWFAFPRMIIADPDGIVRVITNGQDLTADKLARLMKGEAVEFYDPDAVDLLSGEGEIIFKSVLRRWNGERGGGAHTIDQYLSSRGPGFKAPKSSLNELYNTAYTGMRRWFIPDDSLYGKYAFHPLLMTKDSDLFKTYRGSPAGQYYYELDLAKGSAGREEVMARMQGDLEVAFGFNVSIEQREMPVWKFVASDKARSKLATKGGDPYFSDKGAAGGVAGFRLRNSTMRFFIALITKYINEYKYPYLDETGIDANIDINFDALLTDFDQVKRELNRNGLDLILDKQMMNVIVISDPE